MFLPNIRELTKLIPSPTPPTMRISFGSLISSGSKNLLIDSTEMEKQRATKKTELTRAPTTCSRGGY